jgi:hypothetical protein
LGAHSPDPKILNFRLHSGLFSSPTQFKNKITQRQFEPLNQAATAWLLGSQNIYGEFAGQSYWGFFPIAWSGPWFLSEKIWIGTYVFVKLAKNVSKLKDCQGQRCSRPNPEVLDHQGSAFGPFPVMKQVYHCSNIFLRKFLIQISPNARK